MAPKQTPPPAGHRGGMSGWIKSHKGVAIGGAALVAAGGFALWERSRSSSSSSGSGSGSGSDATETVVPTTAGSGAAGEYDDTSSDYNALEQQLSGIQTQLGTVTTTATGAAKENETQNAVLRSQGSALKKLTQATAKKKAPAKKTTKKAPVKKK
jgi:hypothetical protein